MLINELPDDCFVEIFDYIRDLKDLINCFKVCEKWCNLIFVRTKKVKYFIDQPNYSPDSVCHQSDDPIDVTFLSKWLPNLRFFFIQISSKQIADLLYTRNGETPIEDIIKLIRDSSIPENPNLEMLSTGYIDLNIKEINENMKQLYLWDSTLDVFAEVAHHFPNLERFKIYNGEGNFIYKKSRIFLQKLTKILSNLCTCCSFVFMDLCPALQSAHHKIDCWHNNVNDSIKHASLQDLVIQFYELSEWDDLWRLMSKYPNLKHLALRGTSLKDEHIKQLILILPKLTLLDIRESPGVTQEAANHVRDYCKRYSRSIKFYFKTDDEQIVSDWPQLLNQPDKICRGFDFMEHCFFKSFNQLPHFLDPIDD
uniref:F-box domain-containing protein n=1 Tax=Tetranychus urticae TaxID=32264 RepID=T1K4E3_TETUR